MLNDSEATTPRRRRNRRGRGSKAKAKQKFVAHRNLMLKNLLDYYRCNVNDTSLQGRVLHIMKTFGKCEMGLSNDELLVMRYGHIVLTTNCDINFTTKTTLACDMTRDVPIEFDDGIELEDDCLSKDDVTWRLQQRTLCTCTSPAYWFSPLSCGNHSLRDSRYYYDHGNVVGTGYVYIKELDVTIADYDEGYPESIASVDNVITCFNALQIGVTSLHEHIWRTEIPRKVDEPDCWKHWQFEKSLRCFQSLREKRYQWRQTDSPYLALEVGRYNVFLPDVQVPRCIEQRTMRQNEIRVFHELEAFKKCGGSKIAIIPPGFKGLESVEHLVVTTNANVIFTIRNVPIVRVTKNSFKWMFNRTSKHE